MIEVSKVFHMSMKVLCIGSHYMLKLCFNVRPSEYDQKSTFTDNKPECASYITALNACNGYFIWSPNESSIGHLIPYSMPMNSKGTDETEQMRRLA